MDPTVEVPTMPYVTFTIVYDNNRGDEGLRTGWGFACLVESEETTVLFDTGGDASTLLANLEALGKDPAAVDAVVLSHVHQDHTGGLGGLLAAGAEPAVYVPVSFPASFKREVAARTTLVEVEGPAEIGPGVHTTGEVEGRITEQALVVETAEGWVLVTGCAHPGIVEVATEAREIAGGDIALAVGGFHLKDDRADEIEEVIAGLRALGVAAVAPVHCSGDRARALFAETFGEACHLVGVGAEFRFER
jgi:7,8-dihydropterin-6-yl-methyl-4-(beta-D-ribofuranosyl)aminobenzene 5'-phosphate synthase